MAAFILFGYEKAASTEVGAAKAFSVSDPGLVYAQAPTNTTFRHQSTSDFFNFLDA